MNGDKCGVIQSRKMVTVLRALKMSNFVSLSFLKNLASVFWKWPHELRKKENWTWPLSLSIFQLVSLQQLETRALCFSRAHEEPITLKLARVSQTWAETETANKVHKRQDLQRVKCLGKLSKLLMTSLTSKFQAKQKFWHSKSCFKVSKLVNVPYRNSR